MRVDKINVRIDGLCDIMFDRFIDHNKEDRPPEQKFYLKKNKLYFPSINIDSFLFSKKSPYGCAKVFGEREGNKLCDEGNAFITIDPLEIQFLDDNDDEVEFTGFDGDKFWIFEGSAKNSSNQKMLIKKRPVMALPWSLKFNINILENEYSIDNNRLYGWFTKGGMRVGLGSYRPKFGRFVVSKWDILGIK